MANDRLPEPGEAVVGLKLAADTARRLLDGAQLLAAGQHYGPARSLAVLAFEESVKARTLAHMADPGEDGVIFSEDVLKKIIFSGHVERHDTGFYQQMVSQYPAALFAALAGLKVEADDVKAVAEWSALKDSANADKMAGFYTDFYPSTSKWRAPAEVSQAEFEMTYKLAKEFQDATEGTIKNFG
ncbi:AbiV family abortive infection protein [Streptacidiphilus carbonis]|uniref:AbiV family abortive infection protein n=1 Tax=Streptacidiphilus carbonis TaxID=105422 RepID=UPI0005A70407|nr:AbiV family abortive infection protein [Streptacidiphilus carbonis]